MSDEELVRRLRTLVDTEDMHPLSIFAETICNAADYIEHCHASHDAMAKEIERLTRECEKAFTAMRVFERYRELEAQIAATTTRAEAAERKVDKLREALAPFAEAVISFSTTAPDDIDVEVTAGDVRRARAALAETEDSHE